MVVALAGSPSVYDPDTGSRIVQSISNPPLLISGIVFMVSGIVLFFTGWISALVNVARAKEWVWFVLLLCLQWIGLIVYLFAGPKVLRREKVPAYSQPHQDPPQLLYVQQSQQSESRSELVRWD